MIGLGREGTLAQTWDGLAAAVALEAGFALFAFFLAMQIRGERKHLGLLVAGTLIMGSFSAVANVAYYTKYSPADPLTWAWWQSVILGLSAPSVAIMTAILAGAVEGIREESDQSEHDRAMALEKERTAQARAAAREAKALAGKVPEGAGSVGVVSGNGRMTAEKLLDLHPEAVGWTGTQIADVAGVSARTGRNWRARYREGVRDGA